jgi:hypothetical protein
LALELIGEDSVAKWKALVGQPSDAKKKEPTVMGQFGTDNIRDAVYATPDPSLVDMVSRESASEKEHPSSVCLLLNAPHSPKSKELGYFFSNPRVKSPVLLQKCSVCVIKPHSVLAGMCLSFRFATKLASLRPSPEPPELNQRSHREDY